MSDISFSHKFTEEDESAQLALLDRTTSIADGALRDGPLIGQGACTCDAF